MKMKTVTARGGRPDQLKALAARLAAAIDACQDGRELPQLARQYRDTIREIEEVEGAGQNDDEIGEVLAQRAADGKPGAVRKNRT